MGVRAETNRLKRMYPEGMEVYFVQPGHGGRRLGTVATHHDGKLWVTVPGRTLRLGIGGLDVVAIRLKCAECSKVLGTLSPDGSKDAPLGPAYCRADAPASPSAAPEEACVHDPGFS